MFSAQNTLKCKIRTFVVYIKKKIFLKHRFLERFNSFPDSNNNILCLFGSAAEEVEGGKKV